MSIQRRAARIRRWVTVLAVVAFLAITGVLAKSGTGTTRLAASNPEALRAPATTTPTTTGSPTISTGQS